MKTRKNRKTIRGGSGIGNRAAYAKAGGGGRSGSRNRASSGAAAKPGFK